MTTPRFDAGRVYLGWQHVLRYADPGPAPRRPAPPEPEQLNPGWLAAQRREENLLRRPAALAVGGWAAAAVAVAALGQAGLLNAALTWLGTAFCVTLAGKAGYAIWRGERLLRASVVAETQRIAVLRAAQERELFSRQEEHARQFRDWQSRERAFTRQPRWYPAAVPAEIDRVDVVGGTLPGWAALLTTLAAARLASGGEVTVIDLSEGAVARDLVALAHDTGARPLVWVLPGDLPRLDLGVGLPGGALADVLATSVGPDPGHGPDAGGGADPARDHAIIGRIVEVLGEGTGIAQVTAGLRALAQIGDPRQDIAAGLLTSAQLERITGLFGRSATDRVVIERAWALEARLRHLERLGTGTVPLPLAALRVLAVDRGAGASGNAVIGTYATVALTHLLRQVPPGQPWRHTVCLAGAEKLRSDVLDRLCDACEITRTGLVLSYRSVPGHVKGRLGRGNAALAVMRLGNAEDAKVVSEQIGTEHRFVLSQLTDTVGTSVTGTLGGSYTSTVSTADSVADSVSDTQTSGRSRGRGHSRTDLAPFGPHTGSGSREASRSRGWSDSRSLTEGITTSTSWGASTAIAIGANESLGRTAQRSREFLVEPHELQQLPPSAVIIAHASAAGRRVMLADANPGIMALPATTLLSPEEAARLETSGRAEAAGWAESAGPVRGTGGTGGGTDGTSGTNSTVNTSGTGGTGSMRGTGGAGEAGGTGGVGGKVRAEAPGADQSPSEPGGGRSAAAGPDGAGPGTPDGAGPGTPDGAGPGTPDDGAPAAPGAAGSGPAAGPGSLPVPLSWRSRAELPPNLGPPPQPPDWRKRRRS